MGEEGRTCGEVQGERMTPRRVHREDVVVTYYLSLIQTPLSAQTNRASLDKTLVAALKVWCCVSSFPPITQPPHVTHCALAMVYAHIILEIGVLLCATFSRAF